MVTARRMVEAVEHRKAEIVGFYANVLCLGKPWLSACCLLSAWVPIQCARSLVRVASSLANHMRTCSLCCISQVPVVTILTGSGVLACTLYVAVPRAAWERLHQEVRPLPPAE